MPLNGMKNPILLLLCSCIFASCSNIQNEEEAKVLQEAFFSLLGNDRINEKLEKVELITSTSTHTYMAKGTSDSSLENLRKCLKKTAVSGSNILVKDFGWNRKKVGTMILYSETAEVRYEIYRSLSKDSLFCITVPLVGDKGGASLYYFHNSEDKATNDNYCDLWK